MAYFLVRMRSWDRDGCFDSDAGVEPVGAARGGGVGFGGV